MIRDNKGITLIALVITIIILLILAGISITSLTGSGLLKKTELANQNTKYTTAKEVVNLKLMEIQLECIEKNEEYDIIKIAEGIKKAKDITIEKYYNKEIASIKEGIPENIINLEAIVVSVNKYSEYKFLIGEVCQITGVLIGEVTNTTNKENFVDIIKFEKEFYSNNKAKITDIYNNGILNTELVGDWDSEGHANQKQDINTNNIYFRNTATGSYSNRMFWLNKKIDLSQYNNLVIEWQISDRKMCVFGITPNKPLFTNVCNDNEGKEQFSTYILGTVTDEKRKEKVDISNIDSGYIAFYLFDVKSYVYRIYLEK